jgi:hypothetical protein
MASGSAEILTTLEAARALGLTTTRVRKMDAVLRPLVLGNGQRLYARAEVERIAAERDASRAARRRTRGAR